MGKATLSSAQKTALCVQWIQRSGVAHTLKDLEKALPQVGSINGMQVKDYIQAMTDENMIRVERIGSGNWYWSFLSDERIKQETALQKAEAEKVIAENKIEELTLKLNEAAREREEEDEMLQGGEMASREELVTLCGALKEELVGLRRELATYSDNDPMEVERKRSRIAEEKGRLDALTDAICSMETYFKKTMGVEKTHLALMQQNWYGSEYDAEAGGLREV